jgi:hypothetical protein
MQFGRPRPYSQHRRRPRRLRRLLRLPHHHPRRHLPGHGRTMLSRGAPGERSGTDSRETPLFLCPQGECIRAARRACLGDGRETQSVLVATAKASAPGVSVTWLSFAMRKCLGHRPNEFARPGPFCDPLALHSVNVSQRTARHLQMCNRFRLRGPNYRRIGGYVGRSSHTRL